MVSNVSESAETSPARSRDLSTRVFLGFLGLIAVFYAVILVYHTTNPPEAIAQDSGLLEQCRQICMQYGLVSTGHIRNDAEAYLRAAQKRRLTEGLSVVLAESTFVPEASQSNGLLEKPAPNFALPDVNGVSQELSRLGKDRPIVVVFYLGYGCSHCVAQLLALDKDQHYFRELDADIVAISSDTSEHTAEKYKEYGEFHFPVLSDSDYAVSTQWGVYQPESDEKPEFMKHGTFVVNRSGKVIWAAVGNEPFLDNKTLLHVIAKSQGLLP
jgi:peroxiredoxin Q/BCP